MGDSSQAYSSQFSDAARVAVENGFATLSRIYPVPAGVSSTLATTSGGIRYKLDLATMLNLRGISGAYDANGKFCGTQANFDGGIKGQLSGYLSVYNSSITDANQRADKVMGVVDKNISDGSTSTFNCAEAMASTNSPEVWVRAIPDQPASGKNPPVPSMTGPLMAMELSHTFGLDTTVSFHSANTQADLTAPDKAYNVTSRSYLSDDRSTMRFVSTNPFNNNNALFEKDDYGHMLCNLGGSNSAACTTGAIGTAVAAGPTFAIFGTTDFTQAGTHVLESYDAEKTPIITGASSDLHVLFFSADGTQVGDIAVPYSVTTSDHDSGTTINNTTAVFGGIFDAPAGYVKVRLVRNGVTLYERSSAPLDGLSAGVGSASPGGSLVMQKTLTTPVIPPKPDIVFLADTTGSMGSALATMRANVASIMNTVRATQPDAQFGTASYKDFDCVVGGTTEVPFTLEQPITADTAAVQAGVNSWTAQPGSGCDQPEAQLWALHRLATDPAAVGYRSGSSKIVVWFGDATGHDPSNGVGLDQVTSELKAAGIRVIAINLVNSAESSSLDSGGQATAITNATGGVLETTADPTTIANEILHGLTNLPATVTPTVSSCDPGLSVGFNPASSTVPSGNDVSFTENVSIAGTAAPGSTLTCLLTFSINGVVPTDPAFTQTISVTLTGGTAVIGSFAAADPSLVKAHVIYDCGNGEKEPAFVGLDGTQVASHVVQFQQNVDPSLACANATGSASLTIVATNGIDTDKLTVPPSPSTLPVTDKTPSAAIYQPTLDATVPYTSGFALNGHVADPEDGNLTPHWTFVSGPVTPAVPTTEDSVDVPAPTGGWPAGDYVIRLTGTDSHGHSSSATTTVHVARYAFSGFVAPVDNPPTVNLGKAGRTYPVKWSLTQSGATVSDLDAVASIKFTTSTCGSAPTDPLETTATGGTSLRYDATAGQYVYNWATPSAPGCYVLLVTLADGSIWPAYFKLS
jgi:hypothetical protein